MAEQKAPAQSRTHFYKNKRGGEMIFSTYIIKNKFLVSSFVICMSAFLLFACGSGGGSSGSSGGKGSIAFTLEFQDNIAAQTQQFVASNSTGTAEPIGAVKHSCVKVSNARSMSTLSKLVNPFMPLRLAHYTWFWAPTMAYADSGPKSSRLAAKDTLLLAQDPDQEVDCEELEIGEIEAYVFDEDGIQIAEGGPWLCERHKATITNVPVRDYVKIVIFATHSESGEYSHRGEKGSHEEPIAILAGKTTAVGVIKLDPINVPNTPVGLVASDGDFTDRIELSWQDVKNEDEYRIYRLKNNRWDIIGYTKMDITSFADYAPTCTPWDDEPIFYYYKVEAYNKNGPSNRSESNDGYTATCPIIPPAAPDDVKAFESGEYNEIEVTWKWDGDEPLDGFRIYRSENPKGPWDTPIEETEPDIRNYLDPTECTDYGEPQIRYYYMVQAYNSAGPSEDSVPDDEYVPVCPIEPPARPFNLDASDGIYPDQIVLTWEWNGEGPLTGFRIYRSGESVPDWDDFFYVQIANPDSRSYTDDNLDCDGEWWNYMVRAYVADVESDDSRPDSGYTANCGINPPVDVKATATSSESIELSWYDVATNETNYRVRRSLSASGPFDAIGAEALSANTESFSDAGLDADTTYYYNIQAYNQGGDSGDTIVDATTGCNILGEWYGDGNESWSDCEDSSDDGRYPIEVTLTVDAQKPNPKNERDVFRMSVTITSEAFPFDSSEIDKSNVVLQSDGQIPEQSYTYTDIDNNEPVSGGQGSFVGSVNDNCDQISFKFDGQDTSGDTCSFEGGFTVYRPGW
jgi:fibronectin type 3 domain-containing protein